MMGPVTNCSEWSVVLFIRPLIPFHTCTGPSFLDALSKHSPEVGELVGVSSLEVQKINLNKTIVKYVAHCYWKFPSCTTLEFYKHLF